MKFSGDPTVVLAVVSTSSMSTLAQGCNDLTGWVGIVGSSEQPIT